MGDVVAGGYHGGTPHTQTCTVPSAMFTTARFTIATAILVALGARAHAQVAQPTPALVSIPSRTYIGFNPIGLPADIGTSEIENAIAPGIPVGGVASYIDVSDRRFTTFDFKIRYYPWEIVLRDYSIGGSIGYTKFSNIVQTVRQELSAPTIGIILDRNWVYGRGQHFIIGTGVGAKRVLASSDDRARADVSRAVVTGRLIIGFAF